ncbi:MAG: NHL repeat-containing protein [Planctomycetota bacterium]|jgi:hypothetical protein
MNVKEHFVKDKLAIAVTSMKRIDSKIYMGLTSGSKVLAVYDIEKDEIELKGEIFPWVKERGYCTKVHNAMGILSDGSVLLGEGNHFTWDGIPVTVNYFSTELPESMLSRKHEQGYKDAVYTDYCLENLENWDRASCDPGGKIVRYDPATDKSDTDYCLENLENWDRASCDPGGKIVRYDPATDKSEVICSLPQYLYAQSMIVDTKRDRAFGHTLPDNNFFYLDMKTKELKNFGHISDFAHHNMVITPEGICYGGWLDRADGALKLLKFDPEKEKLFHANKTIMPDIGPKIAGNQGIDEWLVTKNGDIYVGMVDKSRLYKFHRETEEFELLTSLSDGGRVTSMDEDEDGIIWICADYPHMRLLKFDPNEKGKNKITDCGRVNDTYERCYFHGSCVYENKLYLGETDCFSPSLHIVDLSEFK